MQLQYDITADKMDEIRNPELDFGNEGFHMDTDLMELEGFSNLESLERTIPNDADLQDMEGFLFSCQVASTFPLV